MRKKEIFCNKSTVRVRKKWYDARKKINWETALSLSFKDNRVMIRQNLI